MQTAFIYLVADDRLYVSHISEVMFRSKVFMMFFVLFFAITSYK